ncbi:hypothetical protein E6H16_00470 [Candidatus Bathyarchaeota archaeon]|nr:MAG: hypothetical protein E6H16_00470 [Candidatus Bathyarchaeota archaeon]
MLEASIERGDVRHKASMLLMDNAVLVLFYEEPMRIGTLAFSTPGLRGGATTSSVLLGGKYLIAARALAERAAALFNRMSLVSLNTRLSEGEALRLYSQLLDKVRGEGKSVDLSREKLEVKDESGHDGQDRGRQG